MFDSVYYGFASTVIFSMQGFITDNERALEELFGETVENSRLYDACLNTMATRIATAFASLRVWTKKLLSVDFQ